MKSIAINRYLDHAILLPDMTEEEVKKAIQVGIDYEVKTVCVRPCDVDIALLMCKDTPTEVSTVLGFPHGSQLTEVKVYEAECLSRKGVKEIDMVLNIGWLKNENYDAVQKEIERVVSVTQKYNVQLKVIIESVLLEEQVIKKAVQVLIDAKADFIKTSTGFNGTGATTEVIQIMMENSQNKIKVKPSGGIRDYDTAMKYIEMGVHRLGVGFNSTPVICDKINMIHENMNKY